MASSLVCPSPPRVPHRDDVDLDDGELPSLFADEQIERTQDGEYAANSRFTVGHEGSDQALVAVVVENESSEGTLGTASQHAREAFESSYSTSRAIRADPRRWSGSTLVDDSSDTSTNDLRLDQSHNTPVLGTMRGYRMGTVVRDLVRRWPSIRRRVVDAPSPSATASSSSNTDEPAYGVAQIQRRAMNWLASHASGLASLNIEEPARTTRKRKRVDSEDDEPVDS